MKKRIADLVVAPALCATGWAIGQEILMDMAVKKVIGKYQSASCQQLWAQRSEPKTPEQMKVVQFLRNDPTARETFINRVAGPIANKMFECGMIPDRPPDRPIHLSATGVIRPPEAGRRHVRSRHPQSHT
jgi:hypothetical protein